MSSERREAPVRPVTIALDAMGGDFAPQETVRAALDRASEELRIILFGSEERLRAECTGAPPNPHVTIAHAAQEVEMCDHPVEAYKKKPDSSLRRAVEAVRSGEADAMISAGNTGAVMAASLLTLGPVEGVDRPAIAALLPTQSGRALLIDAGANVDCSAENVYQFALMGSVYLSSAGGIESPRVGLINIGEEPSKGNALAKLAHERLKQSSLNFVGNVEPREFFSGKADVVACDGFIGNVVLKAGEGVAEMIGKALADLAPEIGPQAVGKVLHQLRHKMDYAVYGGAPLLGINGVCFVAHGRSMAFALSNAIDAAAHAARTGFVHEIHERLRQGPAPQDGAVQGGTASEIRSGA